MITITIIIIIIISLQKQLISQRLDLTAFPDETNGLSLLSSNSPPRRSDSIACSGGVKKAAMSPKAHRGGCGCSRHSSRLAGAHSSIGMCRGGCFVCMQCDVTNVKTIFIIMFI